MEITVVLKHQTRHLKIPVNVGNFCTEKRLNWSTTRISVHILNSTWQMNQASLISGLPSNHM